MDNDDFEVSYAFYPEQLMQRVADRALAVVPGADGCLVGTRDQRTLRFVSGAGALSGHVGSSVSLATSLSGLAVRTGEVVSCPDLGADPRADRHFCERAGVKSSVFVPVRRGHEVLGVVAVSSRRKGAFLPADIFLLGQLAESLGIAVGFAGDLAGARGKLAPETPGPPRVTGPMGQDGGGRFLLGLLRPEPVAWMQAKARVQAVIDDPLRVSMVFQPIVDVEEGRAVSVEALARFAAEPLRPPDEWFIEASAAGLSVELEMVAVDKALASVPLLPSDVAMTVNVGPETISHEALLGRLAGVQPGKVVLELTEHVGVGDCPRLRSAVQALRKMGVRLAVDDTGAGISSLSHIVKLAPDFIKLDRELVKGVDIDPVRHALASSLVSFAGKTGAALIAEGVETAGELEALRDAGVRYVQGYYVGRPSNLGSIGWAPRRARTGTEAIEGAQV